ncbi:MAG: hypothetical protein ABIF87_17980 [Pseudomonadota bacterium]
MLPKGDSLKERGQTDVQQKQANEAIHKREFGKIDGGVGTKRKSYIPVVLSREEIYTIAGNLQDMFSSLVSRVVIRSITDAEPLDGSA